VPEYRFSLPAFTGYGTSLPKNYSIKDHEASGTDQGLKVWGTSNRIQPGGRPHTYLSAATAAAGDGSGAERGGDLSAVVTSA
jgi:hypothetical protein